MKVRCIEQVDRWDFDLLTIGKIYEAKINPKWYDFATQCDDGKEEMGGGFSRLRFEWVSGTPEEKAMWDYCEEHGIDGL